MVKYFKCPSTAFPRICNTWFRLASSRDWISHLFNPPGTSRGAYLSTVNDYGDASCFVPGCLPQLFNPVVMPLRFQGSPTLGVSCGRNSETVNSWFKIYLFKMVIFYSYVSLPEGISSISPVPGVPGIPGS
jgi:hypothetical protein